MLGGNCRIFAPMSIAPRIDHTLLRPDLQHSEMLQLMDEANAYGFHSVCIPPSWVTFVAHHAVDRTYRLCTVAGFPIGYDHLEAKLVSMLTSIKSGAEEIDFVINLTWVKSGDWNAVQNEIQHYCDLIEEHKAVSKCIIETSLLTSDEIKALCAVCNVVKPDFVKTSTGFFGEPVQVDTIVSLRQYLDSDIRIKASGGIRTFDHAKALLDAGADRLGCSQSVHIIREELIHHSITPYEIH